MADSAAAEAVIAGASDGVPAEVLKWIAAIEALPRMEPYSHRDATLIQIGFGLEAAPGAFDHTIPGNGARTAGGRLGKAFKDRHIPAVVDAFQNIGKNTPTLIRNVPAFNDLLRWLNSAPESERLALFDFIAARAAQTARPVLSMPTLRVAGLTFAAVAKTLDHLLKIPSGGAYEQFAVAAFLDAALYEFASGGTVGGLRVVTKNINTSDASARTPGDVQIVRGNRIEEVFEVSANNWRSKATQAASAAANAGLSRAHIIAAVEGDDSDLTEIEGARADISVADVRTFVRLVCALLSKPAREHALTKLYEFIDTKQSNPELTNEYVRLLSRLQLTDTAPADVIGDSDS